MRIRVDEPCTTKHMTCMRRRTRAHSSSWVGVTRGGIWTCIGPNAARLSSTTHRWVHLVYYTCQCTLPSAVCGRSTANVRRLLAPALHLSLDLLTRPRALPVPAQLDPLRVPTVRYPALLLQLLVRQARQVRVERPYRLYDEVQRGQERVGGESQQPDRRCAV